MKKIGIVYFSETGNTEQLAKAVLLGLQSQGCVAVIEHKISGTEIVDGTFQNDALFERLLDCDAIIFGSPTYMGNVSASFKAFADKSGRFWSEQRFANKFAAGFTCGTGLNGEQSCTLLTLFTFACQHGMLWIGVDKHADSEPVNGEKLNRMGSQIGVAAHVVDEQLHASDLATANYLGRRVAKIINS